MSGNVFRLHDGSFLVLGRGERVYQVRQAETASNDVETVAAALRQLACDLEFAADGTGPIELGLTRTLR